ncbi:MAG: Cof-type HAD-IIB family hydrolase [Chloroflexota bacterium]
MREAKAESNAKIRLIAVDLDGTLLTSEGVLASEGARLLKAADHNGIHVVLATSRVIHSVRDLCGSLEINSPVICTNGAQVYESINGPVLTSLSFPKEVGLEIARLADSRVWELSTTIGSVTYYRQRPGQALGPFSPGRVIVATNSDAVNDNPTRILASDSEAVKGILSLCESRFSDQCRIETYHGTDGKIHSVGIFPPKANKGNALGSVLRRLKVSQSEVMAIGDDLNDLPMFARSGVSVAMSNAHEQVKKKATAVAPSNDEEGVAWALTKFGVLS